MSCMEVMYKFSLGMYVRYVKFKYLNTALYVRYGSDTSLFQYDYVSAKEKYYDILIENAQVTGKLALAGKPSAITCPRSAQAGLRGVTSKVS